MALGERMTSARFGWIDAWYVTAFLRNTVAGNLGQIWSSTRPCAKISDQNRAAARPMSARIASFLSSHACMAHSP